MEDCREAGLRIAFSESVGETPYALGFLVSALREAESRAKAGDAVGKEKVMNIVYALTSNFVELARPSMRSLLEHNPKAKIYLLTETDTVDTDIPMTVVNVSGQTWFTEQNCVNIHNNFGGYINLIKVCYPLILPKLNKVIHLDADTIICDSLEPFWKTDLKGKWIGAVPEYHGSYRPFGETYYNAGVMVMNLKQMREDGIVPWMVEYLQTVKQPWADQDAFNKPAIEQDKAVKVDIRYNEAPQTGMTNDPAIVHYCGYAHWWRDPWMPRGEYLRIYSETIR